MELFRKASRAISRLVKSDEKDEQEKPAKVAEESGVHDIREKLRKLGPYRTPSPSEVKEAPEDVLLRNMEAQYPEMVSMLKHYELPTDGMPTWEMIKGSLNYEVLGKALKLEEPTLVITPPVSRQAMVEAINAHKVPGQILNTYTYELGNDDLWNGGKPEGEVLPWEVTIVTGIRDVKADKAIKGTNYQRAKAWVNKYADQGVDVINDARTYLALMMRSLQAGKPIDKETWTVLNAKNLTESSLVAGGYWNGVQVCVFNVNPVNEYNGLRSRGSVRVA